MQLTFQTVSLSEKTMQLVYLPDVLILGREAEPYLPADRSRHEPLGRAGDEHPQRRGSAGGGERPGPPRRGGRLLPTVGSGISTLAIFDFGTSQGSDVLICSFIELRREAFLKVRYTLRIVSEMTSSKEFCRSAACRIS